jgi:ABC-type glycerol-3-phosphate transport system permease component
MSPPQELAMLTFLLTLFIAVLVAFAILGMLSDHQAKSGQANLTPGLQLLPGDFKWENESGNVKVYFPFASSIVLSVIVSLIFWLFR